ncbi:MAG: FtsX-like permease family protein [Bacteroidaceae bacterium]|nr:FtsX-like permease family protein [Bacteroidaceae bacterium]
MILHNLKSGWRNILKYKVQNIVSILCLSVGIICFGITLYFTNAWWHYTVKHELDSKFINSWSINSDLDGIAPTTIAFADSLQQLPSVKSVLFHESPLNAEFTLRGKNGKEGKIWETLSFISPDWLKENNFYSVVTGKKIGTLKPGTVVIGKQAGNVLREKGVEPIGARIADSHYAPISDVVISDTNMDHFDGICVVVEGAKNLHKSDIKDILNTEIYSLQIRLNDDDADFKQFAKERKTIRPYEEISESSLGKSFVPLVLLGFMILVFLGASVLIIGLSGYLKMQLQLFTLRSREMALRRCNGAQIRQLFWLYMTEILIVAVITAIVTAIIAYAFQDFMMPKIGLFSFANIMYVNLNAIYRIIAEVLIATFLFAIVLSWFSLRKVISKPLSETVGKSYAHKSAFTKTMQVAQYFVATFFLIAALFVTYGLSEMGADERLGLEHGVDDFKNIVLTGQIAVPDEFADRIPEFEKECNTFPSADKTARFFTQRIGLKQGEYNNERIAVVDVNLDDSVNHYNGFYANPEIFTIYGRKVVENEVRTEHPYDAETTPVFAFPEEAKQMAEALNPLTNQKGNDPLTPQGGTSNSSADKKTSNKGNKDLPLGGIEGVEGIEGVLLPDSSQCVCLGFVRTLPQEIIQHHMSSYYVVASDSMLSKHFDESFKNASELLIKAKNGKTEQLQEEIAKTWDKHFPELAGTYNGVTAYDRWCKEFELYNVIGQLCFLLVAVSILCIILTVYSSVSLETRGRQKEIAIRKVNGAKTKDIIRLFSRYYIRTMAVAFALVLGVGLALIVAISIADNNWPNLEDWMYMLLPYFGAVVIVALITALTVGHKIYKVAKTNAAEYLTQ